MRTVIKVVGYLGIFVAGWLTCFISAMAATKVDWRSKVGK